MWIFDITPIGKPRMTQRDKWCKRKPVVKYFEYCEELRMKARIKDFELGKYVELICMIPMPKSWSKKKRAAMDGMSMEEKPDWDNIGKAFCDALAKEDKAIYHGCVTAFWTSEEIGKIIVVENRHESMHVSQFLQDEAKKEVSKLF